MTVEIELVAVRAGYGPLEALHGVDLVFPAGRVTALTGRNGSGRTTVLDVLAGVVPPNSGCVRWRGRDVTESAAHRRARWGLAYAPARDATFPSLTVAENLGAVADDARLAEWFPELARLLPRRVETLSGGQRQLVALGRTTLRSYRVLLLDEPEQGLAPAVVERTHRLLAETAAAGRTVVVTARALPPDPAWVDFVHVLRRGRVAFSGEPAELADRPSW